MGEQFFLSKSRRGPEAVRAFEDGSGIWLAGGRVRGLERQRPENAWAWAIGQVAGQAQV